MDLGTGIAIVGGIASVVYIVETAVTHGYPLFKKNLQERPLESGQGSFRFVSIENRSSNGLLRAPTLSKKNLTTSCMSFMEAHN